MKLLALILSILIFGTAILPCTDAYSMSEDHTESTHNHQFYNKNDVDTNSTSSTHDHDQDHDHEDSCSPFCTCSCCGIQIITPSFNQLDQFRDEFQYRFIPAFTFHYDMQYSKGIWHPPALS